MHGDNDTPVAVDDAAGHVLQVRSREPADQLQIILVVVDTVAQMVVYQIVPIVVGDNGLTVLLDQIFLNLLAQGGLSVAGGCRCLTKDGNTSIEKEGYIPYSLQA